MDWCYIWSQIVHTLNAIAQPGLMIFTAVLASATIALWRATTGYKKATQELAQLQRVNFVDNIFRHIFAASTEAYVDPTMRALGIEYSQILQPIAQKRSFTNTAARKMVNEIYKTLIEQMLEDIFKEFPDIRKQSSQNHTE